MGAKNIMATCAGEGRTAFRVICDLYNRALFY